MLRFILSLIFNVFLLVHAQNKFQNVQHQTFSVIPYACFIENRGQWHPEVLYMARTGGMDLWILRNGLIFHFFKLKKSNFHDYTKKITLSGSDLPDTISGHVVRIIFNNCNNMPETSPLYEIATKFHYFKYNDTLENITDVRLFREVLIHEIYPGIDVKFYFEQQYPRFNFILKPSANPKLIKMQVITNQSVYIQEQEIAFQTRFGNCKLTEIQAFQSKKQVQIKIKKIDNLFTFDIPDYRPDDILVIKGMIYSTYIGGNSEEFIKSIAFSSNGEFVVVGTTFSTDFPVTSGAYDQLINGVYDVFVTKFNSSNTMLFSTFLGGNHDDEGFDVVIDQNGTINLTGYTRSTNFPVTSNSYDTDFNGDYDIFVTRLNSAGNNLLYSTFIGAQGIDVGSAIDIDNFGNIYVAGFTNSSGFPTTTGAFDVTFNGGYYDIVVFKLNTSGNTMLFSTFLGGNDWDESSDIKVNSSGNVYVTGNTYSNNFPVSQQAIDQSLSIGDAFLSVLETTGSNLVYSTFLGGSLVDFATCLDLDIQNNVFLGGYTYSEDFPVTQNTFDNTFNGGEIDAFFCKINYTNNQLDYSSYLGGNNDDAIYDLKVHSGGATVVVGFTRSPDFPVVPGSFDTDYNNGGDVFISHINPQGNNLLFSSFLGGSLSEISYALAIEENGNAIITGITNSHDFPVTSQAFDQIFNGYIDGFISKLPLTLSNVTEMQTDNPFIVYPSPSSDKIWIKISDNAVLYEGKIQLFDFNGKILFDKEAILENNYELNLESFDPGIYILQIQLPNKVIHTKIVLSK